MPEPTVEVTPPKNGEAAAPESELRRRVLAERWGQAKFRRRVIQFGALLLIALAVLLYYYSGRESTDDAQVDGHLVLISSKVYGNVIQVLVDDNQPVKAGQVLVKIDPRDYQVKVDQARAALAQAEGRLQAAEVNVPLTRETTSSESSGADAQLAAAQADFERARIAYQQSSTSGLAYAQANVTKRQAEFEKAQADLARMRPLAQKDEISQKDLDAFVAAEQVAASELKAAQQQLDAARQDVAQKKAAILSSQAQIGQARAGVLSALANRKQVTVRSANRDAALADVAAAKADLEAALLNLSYTSITAPVDGVVTNKTVQLGEVLQTGQGMFVLVPLNDLWVTANFKETQLAKVRPGQKAEVHVDMYGKTFSGHVDSIAGATGSRLSLMPPENATGNFVKVVQRIPVKIVLDPIPPDKAILRIGMNVDATILTR